MKHNVKKFLSLLLAFSMVLSLMSVGVFAEDATVNSQEELNNAVSSAQEGDTITIGTAGKYEFPAFSKNITIKGNVDGVVFEYASVYEGNIVSLSGGATFENITLTITGGNDYYGFKHSGKIVMNNCVLNGKMFGYGELEFNNCTFNAPENTYSLWTYSSPKATFTGCRFNSPNQGQSVLCYREQNGCTHELSFVNCTFNCTGTAEKSAVMINPTAYKNVNTYKVSFTGCTATGYGTNRIENVSGLVGLKDAVKDNITITIDNEQVYPVIPKVAEVNGTQYPTLAEAIATAQDGETVTLLGNLTLDSTVTIDNGKTFTLDLNGNTLTSRVTVSAGNVTLADSGATKGALVGRFDAYDSSTVTIASGATVNGVVVVWGDGTYGEAGCKTPTLNVYGTINNTEDCAISTNGTDRSEAVINIYNGATVTSTDEIAIYLPSGKLNISGGTITGADAVYFKSEYLNITGGTLVGNGASVAYNYYGNGAYSTGDALVIDSCGYPNGISEVKVSGGTFTSDNAKAVACYTYQQNTPVTGFITGGTFSSKPDTAYVPENYVAAANSDGTYTVIPATVTKNDEDDTYSVTVGETGQQVTASVAVEETNVTAPANATSETTPAEIIGATVTATQIKSDEITNVIVSAVNAAGESATNANTIKLSMLVEDQTSELKSAVTLSSVEETAKANNDVIFEVHPVATVYNNDQELGSSKVENDQLAENTSFEVTIPVPGGISGNRVKVTHYKSDSTTEDLGTQNVSNINGKRYVTVTMSSFSLIGMTGEDGVSPFSAELTVTGTSHSDGKQAGAKTASGYYAVKTDSTVTANLVLKNNGNSNVTVGASTFWLDLDPKLTFQSATLSDDLEDWRLVTQDTKLAFTLGTSSEAAAKTIAAGGSLTMATITLNVGEVTEGSTEQLLDIGLSAMQLQKDGVKDVGGSWVGTQVAVPQTRTLTQNNTTIVNGETTTTTATHEFSLLRPYTITVPTAPNGYEFGGWVLADGANSTWTGYTSVANVGNVYPTLADTTGRDGDATITTRWTPKTYTMKFATVVLDEKGNPVKAFGAEDYAAINAIADVTYTIEQTPTVNNPTEGTEGSLTGYQFTGWKVTVVDPTGTTNWEMNDMVNLSGDATSITMPAYKYGNVTLTAVYTPIEYTVTLDTTDTAVTYTKGTETITTGISTFNIRDGVTIAAEKVGSLFAYWKVSATAAPSNWVNGATYENPAATKGKFGNVTLTPVFTLDATVKISGFAYAGTGNYLMGVMIDTDKVVNGATYKYGEAELYLDGNNVYKTALFGEDATGTVYVTIIAQSELQNTGTETEPVYSKLADATKLGYTAGETSGNKALDTGTAGDVNGNGSVTTADYGAANDLFRISGGLTPAFAESNYTGLSVLGRLMADASHSNDSIGTKFGSIDDIVAIIRLVQNPG